jgi:DNA-binding NarL/FixJ family response regulator
MAEPIRVLVLWRHRVLGEAVASSLQGRPEVRVVAAAGASEEMEGWFAATPAPVEVVLLDASVESGAAVELTYRLRDRHPSLQVVPYGLPSEEDALPFIEAGATGHLCREASLDRVVEEVVGAVQGSAPGSLPLVARAARRVEELGLEKRAAGRTQRLQAARLTEREEEVLAEVARGLANKEIAHRLGIRTATVKNHVHALLAKLGVRRRREAVRLAYETGLLQGPFRWRPLDEEE